MVEIGKGELPERNGVPREVHPVWRRVQGSPFKATDEQVRIYKDSLVDWGRLG